VDSIEEAEKFVSKLCAGTIGRATNGCLDLMKLDPETNAQRFAQREGAGR